MCVRVQPWLPGYKRPAPQQPGSPTQNHIKSPQIFPLFPPQMGGSIWAVTLSTVIAECIINTTFCTVTPQTLVSDHTNLRPETEPKAYFWTLDIVQQLYCVHSTIT